MAEFAQAGPSSPPFSATPSHHPSSPSFLSSDDNKAPLASPGHSSSRPPSLPGSPARSSSPARAGDAHAPIKSEPPANTDESRRPAQTSDTGAVKVKEEGKHSGDKEHDKEKGRDKDDKGNDKDTERRDSRDKDDRRSSKKRSPPSREEEGKTSAILSFSFLSPLLFLIFNL